MKILICLNRDLEANIALNLLLPMLKKHDTHINLSESVGNSSKHIKELHFLEQDLPNKIIFPLLNKIERKDYKSSYLTFEEVSKYYGFPITSISKINDENDGLLYLKDLQPDLIISIRYGQIFKDKAIAIPKHGILNLHSGILPNYRGVIATFRAMANDDKEVGCTLHYINDGTIDTGNIIDVYKIPNNKEKSLIWHIISLYHGGVNMIVEAVDKIDKGEVIKCKPQSREEGAYFTYPTQEEVKAFLDKGYKLSDEGEYMEILGGYIINI